VGHVTMTLTSSLLIVWLSDVSSLEEGSFIVVVVTQTVIKEFPEIS